MTAAASKPSRRRRLVQWIWPLGLLLIAWLITPLRAGATYPGMPCPAQADTVFGLASYTIVFIPTAAILLLLTRNPGSVTEKQIIESSVDATRTVWITRSADDGSNWTPPEEITASVKRPDWTWYATGPGNGIQLRSGRLVIACDHILKVSQERHSHVIYSDDRGKTWAIGGVADDKTNESAVAELRDGSLLLNMRSYRGQNRRQIARSSDRGLTWSKAQPDPALIEPVCQASLIRAGSRLLFSNPSPFR